MAFLQHRLEKVSSFGAVAKESNELSNWLYVSADTLATILGAGYFNAMATKGMVAGDRIRALASDGLAELRVSAVSAAGVITVKRSGGASAQVATVAAVDTIVTGLTTLTSVIATLNDAPVAGCQFVTADLGDQAGAPAAGSFYLKTWKSTAAGDTTQIAATTFGKKVSWDAKGT